MCFYIPDIPIPPRLFNWCEEILSILLLQKGQPGPLCKCTFLCKGWFLHSLQKSDTSLSCSELLTNATCDYYNKIQLIALRCCLLVVVGFFFLKSFFILLVFPLLETLFQLVKPQVKYLSLWIKECSGQGVPPQKLGCSNLWRSLGHSPSLRMVSMRLGTLIPHPGIL